MQLSPAPGTALQSPETGSQNRRHRDLSWRQRPHVPHLNPRKRPQIAGSRDIIAPASVSPHDRRPIRAETRATLVASIVRGRRWLDEIVAGTVTSVEQIAARDKCSIRQVNMTISLAFLAPDLVKAAVKGRLPRGIGVTRLRDAPAEWSRQCAMLGLSI